MSVIMLQLKGLKKNYNITITNDIVGPVDYKKCCLDQLHIICL